MQACFADLSRAELAHIRRCQFIAQAEGMAVVSSGVLAAPVASAPAGAHFWLVSSGLSGVVSVVWLAAGSGAGRLCCGCSRRRAGALTCSHAQTVRLWLLAAAGVRVPVLSSAGLGAAAPDPIPASCGAPSAAVAYCEFCRCPATHDTEEGPLCDECDPDPEPPTPPSSPSPAGGSAPAPAAELAPVVVVATQGVVCPACERPAPAGVIRDWGICAECLDDLAAAEGQPRPRRCVLLDCRDLAIGETAYGAYCAKHLPHYQRMAAESAAWDRRRAEEAAALDAIAWTFDEDGDDAKDAEVVQDEEIEEDIHEARCPRCGSGRWKEDELCVDCMNDEAGSNGLDAAAAVMQWRKWRASVQEA